MNKTDKLKKVIIKKTLKLDCGKSISNFPVAYETYGELNKSKDNAILIFHALTGDQFASDINPITKKTIPPVLNCLSLRLFNLSNIFFIFDGNKA